jgi:hypothetical protein
MDMKETNPKEAPLLCDVLGMDTDSYERFLTSKKEALAQVDAQVEQRIRESLRAELVWAQ